MSLYALQQLQKEKRSEVAWVGGKRQVTCIPLSFIPRSNKQWMHKIWYHFKSTDLKIFEIVVLNKHCLYTLHNRQKCGVCKVGGSVGRKNGNLDETACGNVRIGYRGAVCALSKLCKFLTKLFMKKTKTLHGKIVTRTHAHNLDVVRTHWKYAIYGNKER